MSAKPDVYPATHPSTSINPPFQHLCFTETSGHKSSNKTPSVKRPLMSIETIPIHRKVNLSGASHLPLDKFYSYPFPPLMKGTTFPLLATFLETGASYGLQPATYNFLPIRPHPEHMVASSYQVSAFFSEHFALGLCVFIRSYPNTILVLIHNYNTSEDVNKIIVKH